VLALPPRAARQSEAVKTVLCRPPFARAAETALSAERNERLVTRAKKEGFPRGTMGSPGDASLRSVRPDRNDAAMAVESTSASEALQLPVMLRGIQLGRPIDLLLDRDSWHVLGFVVHCGDESQRFLPLAAAQPTPEKIAVGSALMLLEDVGFYRTRGTSFRRLLGGEVRQNGHATGRLRDLVLTGSEVTELELQRGGDGIVRVPAAGATVVPTRRASAA